MGGGLVTAVVIGAGQRGSCYARYAHDSDRFKVVGVADPSDFRRNKFQNTYKIDKGKTFKTWEDVVKVEKFADCAIICTPDRFHKAPAVALAAKGYNILLEKPMAVSVEDCLDIVRTCRENDVILSVCHVLRYMPQSQEVRRVIESGEIGDVVNIQLLEPVGFWHFAHSYVRGNWRNEGESTFSLLAKSCHDLDLLLYWMGEKKCINVSSFGSLMHFKSENKPEGAGTRCLDCPVERQCPWSAKKIYLDAARYGHRGFPVNIVADIPDIEHVAEALKTGPYGRCVYDCDNDVCDNQVVNMQFEDGATVSFTMVAYTEDVCRRHAKIFGTKGELTVDLGSTSIRHFDFLEEAPMTRRAEHSTGQASSHLKGHSGADYYAMDAFVEAIAKGDRSKIVTGPEETLRSHLLTFAAEEARRSNKVIQFQDWLAVVAPHEV